MATCGQYPTTDPRHYSICLTGRDIVFSGSGAEFTWANVDTGPDTKCDSEGVVNGQQRRDPMAFGLYGNDNTLSYATLNLFQEGIEVGGTNNIVEVSDFEYYCDEAITVRDGAQGFAINSNDFFGHTSHSACAEGGTCGFDKAVQINGGNGAVRNNWFEQARAPVRTSQAAGIITVEGNHAQGIAPGQCGSPFKCTHQHFPDNFCAAFEFDTGDVTATGNEMSLCRYGFHVTGDAQVLATDNTIVDGHVSAFYVEREVEDPQVSYQSRLRAEGNRIKGAGWSPEADCNARRTAVTTFLTGSTDSSKVDFGGGDSTGTAVLDWLPGLSAGGNIFCQKASNSRDSQNHNDIRNNSSGSCLGGTAPFGARNNCFDNGPDVGGNAVTTGDYTNCDCSFEGPSGTKWIP